VLKVKANSVLGKTIKSVVIPLILKVDAAQYDEARELLKDFQGGMFGQGTL